MGFFSKVFGDEQAADASVARRELLRVALRDTLNNHGIPPAWLGAETLVTTSRAQRGIHWRLLVKHWEPQLLLHSVALQQNLMKRLMALDPKADSWLMGISWQFALPDESVCPPMPPRLAAAAAQAAAAVPRPAKPPQPAAPAGHAKADLEQMFAARDEALRREADDPGAAFQRTEPAPL
jgi:hypothetical protein